MMINLDFAFGNIHPLARGDGQGVGSSEFSRWILPNKSRHPAVTPQGTRWCASRQRNRLEITDPSDPRAILRGFGLLRGDRILNGAIVAFGGDTCWGDYPQTLMRMARFRGKDRLADFDENRQVRRSEAEGTLDAEHDAHNPAGDWQGGRHTVCVLGRVAVRRPESTSQAIRGFGAMAASFSSSRSWHHGNGRLGRLWQILILSRWKPLFALVPVESLIRDQQPGYYAALNESSRAGASTPFIAFMLQVIHDALSGLDTTPQVDPQVTPPSRAAAGSPHRRPGPRRPPESPWPG